MDLIAHLRLCLVLVHPPLDEVCGPDRWGRGLLPHQHNSSTRHSVTAMRGTGHYV